MELTLEQSKKLRQPFEEIRAFEGRSEEEIGKLLEGIAVIYVTFAKINLRIKKESLMKSGKHYGI